MQHTQFNISTQDLTCEMTFDFYVVYLQGGKCALPSSKQLSKVIKTENVTAIAGYIADATEHDLYHNKCVLIAFSKNVRNFEMNHLKHYLWNIKKMKMDLSSDEDFNELQNNMQQVKNQENTLYSIANMAQDYSEFFVRYPALLNERGIGALAVCMRKIYAASVKRNIVKVLKLLRESEELIVSYCNPEVVE